MTKIVPVVYKDLPVPLPQVPLAATVRVYRFKTGETPSAPQGGRHHGLASREDLRHLAKDLWRAEVTDLQAKAIDPTWVLSNELGPDLLMVSLQHPTAGVLRVTVIAVEPV